MRKIKKQPNEQSVQNKLRINALCWKAKELGISYGKVSSSSNMLQTEEIVAEYLQYLNNAAHANGIKSYAGRKQSRRERKQ